MLELPAYRVLSLAAHRMLDRLDVELGHHGGTENGNLIVTYRQFEAYGIHKDSVGPAQRELEALGFIEITERGCAGNAGFGKPNEFRLTFHPAEGAPSTALTSGGASRPSRTPSGPPGNHGHYRNPRLYQAQRPLQRNPDVADVGAKLDARHDIHHASDRRAQTDASHAYDLAAQRSAASLVHVALP